MTRSTRPALEVNRPGEMNYMRRAAAPERQAEVDNTVRFGVDTDNAEAWTDTLLLERRPKMPNAAKQRKEHRQVCNSIAESLSKAGGRTRTEWEITKSPTVIINVGSI